MHRASGHVVDSSPTSIDNVATSMATPVDVVEDIMVRRLLRDRTDTIFGLSEALGVPVGMIKGLIEDLRSRAFVDVEGMDGRDFRIALTSTGVDLAEERRRHCSYAGPCPVTLAEYTAMVAAQRPVAAITRESLGPAFGDLVVAPETLAQIGTAVVSQGAIFLYGPAGTGKTSIAERMIRLFADSILVPHAIEVDRQIVTLFDPAVHQPVVDSAPEADGRWVRCHRPLVMAGGELTLDMFELDFDENARIHSAPIQVKANNGVLLIDDFGRQAATPDQVLNRLIVPLSRAIDFLRLSTGHTFQLPFEARPVISTNLEPASLGDEAFLRRLRNKVFIGPCTPEAFNWILARSAQKLGIEITAQVAQHLRELSMRELGGLRPYVATDFCELIQGVAIFEGGAISVDEQLIDRIAAQYFVIGDEPEPQLAVAMAPPPMAEAMPHPPSRVPLSSNGLR